MNMAATTHKGHRMMACSRTLLTIVTSLGGLTLFIVMASSMLISQPIGYKVQNYFFHGVDNSRKIDLVTDIDDLVVDTSISSKVIKHVGVLNSTTLERNGDEVDRKSDGQDNSKGNEVGKMDQASEVDQNTSEKSNGECNNNGDGVQKQKQASESRGKNASSESGQGEDNVKRSSSAMSENSTMQTNSGDINRVPSSGGSTKAVASSASTKKSEADSFDSECDLYHGKWIHDTAGPLYTNNSCPVLTQTRNCQGNGRPDKDYENWRWKPDQCHIPRFEPRKFLELMRGKTLAFIGDSIARNQLESMLCILWQVEVPKNRGSRKMQCYYFRSTSTMIVRIRSSWLVHQTSEPFDFAPAGVTQLNLDAPDESFMELITGFDVIVLSSGHWFVKQSVYILNNEIVGGQLWWPDKSKQMKINNIEAFGISVETILSAMVTHPNYTGLTILRSFSPDHYERGAWNTGGSCTGKVRPAMDSELVENDFTNIMHEKQVTGFNRAIKKKTNKSKLKLMDITKVFSYRHDGHPGPYRSPDPSKITTRGPDGRPPPQDCLHWCMPGPVDTWNEMVFEIIRREFEDRRIPS